MSDEVSPSGLDAVSLETVPLLSDSAALTDFLEPDRLSRPPAIPSRDLRDSLPDVLEFVSCDDPFARGPSLVRGVLEKIDGVLRTLVLLTVSDDVRGA